MPRKSEKQWREMIEVKEEEVDTFSEPMQDLLWDMADAREEWYRKQGKERDFTPGMILAAIDDAIEMGAIEERGQGYAHFIKSHGMGIPEGFRIVHKELKQPKKPKKAKKKGTKKGKAKKKKGNGAKKAKKPAKRKGKRKASKKK